MGKSKHSKREEQNGRNGASRARSQGIEPVDTAALSKHERQALMDELRAFVRARGPAFLDDPNITSVGIGYKICNGVRTDQLCIQFTVAEKVESTAGLEALGTERIPRTLEVAGRAIPTDVIERDFAPAWRTVVLEAPGDRKRRLDPLVPGVSVCHPGGTAGTLGMIVFDRATGDPCMLSNWHVLHLATGAIGDDVVQPGPHDDNAVRLNRAGRLLRSHLGAAGDCAVARIENRAFRREILDLNVAPRALALAELGDRVIKSGRTTDVTRGIVRRVDVMARIDYPGLGARDIGGFEIGPEDGAGPDVEISMGGDSGSAWLVAGEDGQATDVVVGLHFAGESAGNPDEHALACNLHSVLEKLDVLIDPPAPGALEVTPSGYDEHFLDQRVRVPWLNEADFADAVPLNGRHLIPYTHFSVCLSGSLGFARFVAWNIDGSRIQRISRDGDPFDFDQRVPAQHQHGNELYTGNALDRGHIARRADLCWGSVAEARQANLDSFRWPNIAPQHEAFNRSSAHGIWGELENAVFADVEVEGLRVSVLGGPIFSDEDPIHRGVPIPRQFWKLVAYTDSEDGAFKVRAFVLTQRDLLTGLEALELDPFRVFQVSLSKLAGETGLGFGSLGQFDTFEPPEDFETLTHGRRPEAREVGSSRALFA